MTTAIATRQFPTDERTGLTLPLRTLLDSQDLAKHRAMVALELEVMAKKMDRFGWDRDRGSAAHDRIIMDWMDALQDFPLGEIREACRAWVMDKPRSMPNEGDIRARVLLARKRRMRIAPEPEKERPRVSPEAAAEILARANFEPRGM